MKITLTPQQREDQEAFRAFVQQYIVPGAGLYDQEQYTPPALIREIARRGYLGAIAGREWGGSAMEMVTLGLLHEEFGRGCSSLRSLLTVQSMVIYALQRWGNLQQKARWLPRLATGECIAAFGLSEPAVGSDTKSIETTALLQNDTFILNGQKKWMTYGQIADVFLLFAHYQGDVSAFLVERGSPGLILHPIRDILGTRASMLAELELRECAIPQENLLGRPGSHLSPIVSSCLDIGRYSVACGCVGLAQACLDASFAYASQRQQFGKPLNAHQLIQQMLTNMLTSLQAARLLCYQAGYLKEIGDPATVSATWMAKYFASLVANNAARDAVQIHGANGVTKAYPVERYLRDARIMEIIEGSTQIQQLTIAQYSGQYVTSTQITEQVVFPPEKEQQGR